MRGQTLVLFALSLLLLTLLVLMTIGLGVRLHERTEQQVVADAAAYSQAVVTARTFNAVSSLNRAIIAQMSSLAAAQSLLSWAGFYHGTLNQGRDLLASIVNNSGVSEQCKAPLRSAHAAIEREDRRLIDIWEPVGGGYDGQIGHDRRASNYIRRIVYQTAITMADDQRVLYEEMMARVMPGSGEGIAEVIAAEARQGSPWRDRERELFAAAQPVTKKELEKAVEPKQTRPKHMVRATMATRGIERFISSREATPRIGELSAANYVEKRLNRVMDPTPIIAVVNSVGTSYFGSRGPERSSGLAESEGYDGQIINRAAWQGWRSVADDGAPLTVTGLWAQDNGSFHFEWPNPPPGCELPQPTEDSFGYALTTGPGDGRDNHMWRRGDPAVGDYREWNDARVEDPPIERHSFEEPPPHADGPSIWPVFVDYKESALKGPDAVVDMDGQPKSLVPIVRDYAVRTRDPWELHFRFRFANDTTELDLRASRPELSRSTAIAAGLTYYHRGSPTGPDGPGHAAEPPNFLNPFWRATLVASDVDEPYNQRGNGIITTLEPLNQDEQINALKLLRDRGFEALP
jgi:hypothetical protein